MYTTKTHISTTTGMIITVTGGPCMYQTHPSYGRENFTCSYAEFLLREKLLSVPLGP